MKYVMPEIVVSVPLLKKMGTAWDVANASMFLASEEANLHYRANYAG